MMNVLNYAFKNTQLLCILNRFKSKIIFKKNYTTMSQCVSRSYSLIIQCERKNIFSTENRKASSKFILCICAYTCK